MMDPFNNDGIGQQQNLPGTSLRIENLAKDAVICYGAFGKYTSMRIIDEIRMSSPMIALTGEF